jgi:hypothetical protein
MEVAPALAPHGSALLPAQAVAGEEDLDPLGEAGLARAVAPDDEREAGARRKLQRLRGTDPAEPLDGDRPQEGADQGDGRRRGRRSQGGGPARQLRLERLAALQGGEHETGVRLVERAVRLEPRQHEAPDAGIHLGLA